MKPDRLRATEPDRLCATYKIIIDALANDPNEIIVQCKSDMKLASGREYKNRYIIRVTIQNNKIAHFSEYFDPIPLIKALGGDVSLPD